MVARLSNSYRLLIADDDAGFREILREIFEPFFVTLEVESGEEAIEVMGRQAVHIALFDMHMHVLSGLETVRIVKSLNAVAPCILITADATDELRRDATDAHAWSVLQKPVRKAELVTTVSTAIQTVYNDPEARLLLSGV